MPKTNLPADQLRRGHQQRRMPEQIMKGRRDAPTTEGVKQSGRRIGRFICMKLVEEIMRRMVAIHQLRELCAQHRNLLVIEEAQARQIALGVEEVDLIRS